MSLFRLSQQAEIDLEDIWIFLAKQDGVVADKQISNILNRISMLSQFPDMGKKRDDLAENLRSFPIKPYLIFYRKVENRIEIIRILHQSRDVESQFNI